MVMPLGISGHAGRYDTTAGLTAPTPRSLPTPPERSPSGAGGFVRPVSGNRMSQNTIPVPFDMKMISRGLASPPPIGNGSMTPSVRTVRRD
jgi:hypothetical protein